MSAPCTQRQPGRGRAGPGGGQAAGAPGQRSSAAGGPAQHSSAPRAHTRGACGWTRQTVGSLNESPETREGSDHSLQVTAGCLQTGQARGCPGAAPPRFRTHRPGDLGNATPGSRRQGSPRNGHSHGGIDGAPEVLIPFRVRVQHGGKSRSLPGALWGVRDGPWGCPVPKITASGVPPTPGNVERHQLLVPSPVFCALPQWHP